MFSKIRTLSLIALFLACASSHAAEAPKKAEQAANPIAIISTNQGDITLELFAKKAPVSVANFIDYANSGFYNGTIFHRVIQNFMIQGGGFNKSMAKKSTKAPIVNESFNGVGNHKYTIAMARTNNPDSATSQFFINTQNNASLNAVGERPGYAVFGKVTEGQVVVDNIERSKTTRMAMYADVPVEQVVIKSVTIK